MEEQKFRYADRTAQTKKINHFLALGIIVFSIILGGIVFGSVMNQYRSVTYFIALVVIMVISNVLNMIIYKKKNDSEKLRYVAMAELLMLTLLITAVYSNDYMRFMTVIPLMGCIIFYDVRFSVIGAVGVSLINIGTVLYRAYIILEFTGGEIGNRLTACLILLVMMFIMAYTTFVGKKFNEDSLNKVKADVVKQKNMVAEVLGIAEQVQKDTATTMTLINDLKGSSEIVHQSARDISMSTNQTAENIQGQTVMTQNIQNNIDKTLERSAHMVHVAERSKEVNSQNMDMVSQLKKQAEVLAVTNARVAKEMHQLQENVNSVKNITGTIVSISSQTNLLALNASIESARAGEAGRGFAVVAEQIRELSENTRRETEQISAILEALANNAGQTVEAVEQSVQVSKEQDGLISGVADKFSEMNSNVNELVGDISVIDNMIEDLSKANNQIVDNIMQLSAATEEVTAAAEQSAEITERNFEDSVRAQKLLADVLEVSHQTDKYKNM